MPDVEKQELTSLDVKTEQLQKLKQIFPEVFTEGNHIDFDKLRLTLGDDVDTGRERYGMNWPGKAGCFKTIQQPSIATLIPCAEESLKPDATKYTQGEGFASQSINPENPENQSSDNLFIEGDNLEVLKLLQKSYLGKIKMIYIDPPYNTGRDILYSNDFSDLKKDYLRLTNQLDEDDKPFYTNTESEGSFHGNWMNMMYSRIFISKNLLKDNGVFVVAIDHYELSNLIAICNEIFGEENKLGIVAVVHKPEGRNQSKFFGVSHEYMIFYAKNKDNCSFNKVLLDEDKFEDFNEEDEEGKFKLKNFIRLSDGKYSLRENKPDFFYPIYVSEDNNHLTIDKKIGFHEVYPITLAGQERTWKTTKETCEDRIIEGSIICKNENGQRVIYEKLREDQVIKTHWIDKKYHAYHFGTKVLDDLLKAKTFDFPKSLPLIIDTLKLVIGKNDTVLDFFAGSSTTAHAVIDLNSSDGGNRKFICVQIPHPITDEKSEAFKAGYTTIAEISKERIRRVAAKIKTEMAAKAAKAAGSLFNTDNTTTEIDLGFKVFKLAPSNFKRWDNALEKQPELLQQKLFDHIEHINADAEQEAILYELLLKSGFELTTPIVQLTLAEKKVYSVADGALLICLENELSLDCLKAMAELCPPLVICLDRSFTGENGDALKTNAVQIMKSKGVGKFRTV